MSGVANPLLPAAALDTPITYDDLRAAGGGLGAAGFIVFDDTTDLVAVAAGVARFLAVESCGQCRHCKDDGLVLAELLAKLAASDATERDVDEIGRRLDLVAEGARCNLATQQQVVIGSVLQSFPAAVSAHVGADGNGTRAGVHRRARRDRRRPCGAAGVRSARSSPTGPTTRSTPASGPPTASTTPARPGSSDDPIRSPETGALMPEEPLSPRTRPTPGCRRRSPTWATSRVPACSGTTPGAPPRRRLRRRADRRLGRDVHRRGRVGRGRRVRGVDRPARGPGLILRRAAPRPDPVAALGTTGSGQGGSGCGLIVRRDHRAPRRSPKAAPPLDAGPPGPADRAAVHSRRGGSSSGPAGSRGSGGRPCPAS